MRREVGEAVEMVGELKAESTHMGKKHRVTPQLEINMQGQWQGAL